MKTVSRDPRAILREHYRSRFVTPHTDGPVRAFRESYARDRYRTELGMRDANDDGDDEDVRNQALTDAVDLPHERAERERADDAGDGMMSHTCSCGATRTS
jgi:hypothetical protein